MRVCPPPRLLITSGVMWTPYDWLNIFYSFLYIDVTVNGRSLGIGTRVTRRRASVIRMDVAYLNVRVSRRLKKSRVGLSIDKWLQLIINTMLVIPLRI